MNKNKYFVSLSGHSCLSLKNNDICFSFLSLSLKHSQPVLTYEGELNAEIKVYYILRVASKSFVTIDKD